jgi:hypothetical protein
MGNSGIVTEVEDRIPGVRFSVSDATRTKRAGYVVLRCDVNDVALWDACVAKLNGLKIFSGDLVDEVLGALGGALTDKEEELQAEQQRTLAVQKELEETKAELARLRGLMHSVGMELGIEER